MTPEEYQAAIRALKAEVEMLRELVEERVEARRQPKPDGWARNWTKRAAKALAATKET